MRLIRSALRKARMRVSLHVVQPLSLLLTRNERSNISVRELREIERSIRDTPEWRELRRVAQDLRRTLQTSDPMDASKYLDVDLWLRVNVLRAARLGLHRRKGLSVLDLGCGTGLFLYVCRTLGHNVTGLDLPVAELSRIEAAVYSTIPPLLQVDVLHARMSSTGRLPHTHHYDLVTAFMMCFNGHNTSAEWSAPEWQTFGRGIAQHLEPGGRLHLGFNPRHGVRGPTRFYDQATAHWLRECEAETRFQSATLTREAIAAIS